MDRTCSACAFCTPQDKLETRGILWWEKLVTVRHLSCSRLGPERSSIDNARGSWRPPAVIGPGAKNFFVEGPCGIEGKYFVPKDCK